MYVVILDYDALVRPIARPKGSSAGLGPLACPRRPSGCSLLRARALLGGAAILAAVVLWHRPSLEHGSGAFNSFGCAARGDGSICDAVAGLAKVVHSPILPANAATLLPPLETPGAIDPAITQDTIDATICRPGYARAVRPAYAITGPLKRRMMDAQHPGEPMADYELDHLIPISIGGAPLDARDLWLQPRRGQANAGDKNVLAYVLWRLVCTHQVPLATAQHDISHDWTRAYQLYATPTNIQKYHVRHAEEQPD